jgi:hypothetical protein
MNRSSNDVLGANCCVLLDSLFPAPSTTVIQGNCHPPVAQPVAPVMVAVKGGLHQTAGKKLHVALLEAEASFGVSVL